VQGGLDYTHSSGLYIGTWGSSISWLTDMQVSGVSAPIEVDVYGGYRFGVKDLAFDVGVLQYWYPGNYPSSFTSPDTLEGYGSVAYKFVSFKYSRSFSNLFGATSTLSDGSTKRTDGSQYFDLSANPDLGGGFTLNLHVGRQLVANYPMASYYDYKAGVTKDLSGWALSLAYIGTDAKGKSGEFYHSALNKDLGDDKIVVSLGKTF
jgi:uncharacterized protein (TIGR02001 family)